MHLRPAHEYLRWWQLRQQLGAARSSTALGDIPLIAALAAELGSLDDATQATGHAPFEQGAHRTFGSLVDDLRRAHANLGQELQSITKEAIEAVDALGYYAKCTQPPWDELIEATRPLRRALLLGRAVVVGFDDALEAARKVGDPGGYDRLGRRLDELRILSEHQGRGWKSVSGAIDEHFSVPPDDRPRAPGESGAGTPAEVILERLRERLEQLPVEQEWVVWVGALAGPSGGNDRFSSLVSGPVTVCGVPCGGKPEEWLVDARASLEMAFRDAGQDVPADVRALGEAIRFQGVEFTSAAELWGSLGRPASFVARVVVSAQSGEQAIVPGKAMMRALRDGGRARRSRPSLERPGLDAARHMVGGQRGRERPHGGRGLRDPGRAASRPYLGP